MPEEVINAQALSESQDSTASTDNSEQLDPRLEALRQEAEPEYGIPEKFRGKSAQEIVKSYQELEKQYGKVGSEKAHAEKAAEEAKARAAQVEQERQALFQQLQSQHTRQTEPQQSSPDPLSSFDADLEKDPIEAVKKAVKGIHAQTQKTREELRAEMQTQQGNEFYQRQLKENPDFVENHQTMQQIAQELGGMIRPELAGHPMVLKTLHALARERNMDKYIQSAVTKTQSASDMVKAEKRAAYSESSSSSEGAAKVRPEDMTTEELERLLGFSNK